MTSREQSPADPWQQVADASFASVGTYRANGELVRTPVWVAPLGDTIVLTSEVSTGKIRRLRRDDRVVLHVCSRRGKLDEHAPDVEATGTLVTDPAASDAALGALRAKYGFQVRAFLAVERLVRKLQRKPFERVIVSMRRTGTDQSGTDQSGSDQSGSDQSR